VQADRGAVIRRNRPSRRRKQAAGAQAAEVAAIERRLAAANARSEQLAGPPAGRGAYNGALYRLQEATSEAARAAARAARAKQAMEAQRLQIGRFAAANYQGGGDLAKFGPMFGAEGPQALLDSAAAVHTVSLGDAGLPAALHGHAGGHQRLRLQADEALARVTAAKDAAAAAKAGAQAAEAARLPPSPRSMPCARTRSAGWPCSARPRTGVAEQRQNGLEELARQRAAAAAAKKAEDLRRRTAAKQAAEAAERAEAAAKAATVRTGLTRSGLPSARRKLLARRGTAAGLTARRPPGVPRRPPPRPNGNPAGRPVAMRVAVRVQWRWQWRWRHTVDRSRCAGKAIAFARKQLGEPYVWGAAGPGSWDCSGLTMAAWQSAGVRLPHYSVAQYERVAKIAEDDLRPGDLIFWATSRTTRARSSTSPSTWAAGR
jgi:cell wall-associated NlpC family hydrolase